MQTYRNVNHALPHVYCHVMAYGVEQYSRNGRVKTLSSPFMLQTENPQERVLLCPVRRANPFLFLLDGLSILSSVNLVKPFANIAPRFLDYSDDGISLRGHYGRRLAHQIPVIIDMLRQDPFGRRGVMNIWSTSADLNVISVDVPCNIAVIPRINERPGAGPRLDLTVISRSNDLLWGMLGANIVQFSFLQEYLAAQAGVLVGNLYQMTTNLHVYDRLADRFDSFPHPHSIHPPVVPLDTTNLINDLNMMFLALAADDPLPPTGNKFLSGVVYPMLASWKDKSTEPLKDYLYCDWFAAADMWWSK